jgi:hypothetical protein
MVMVDHCLEANNPVVDMEMSLVFSVRMPSKLCRRAADGDWVKWDGTWVVDFAGLGSLIYQAKDRIFMTTKSRTRRTSIRGPEFLQHSLRTASFISISSSLQSPGFPHNIDQLISKIGFKITLPGDN